MSTHDDPTNTTTDTDPDSSAADSSQAATRLLEAAARSADELLAEARIEADHITTTARQEADQLLTAARTEAQRVRADLQETLAQQNAEIARLQQLEQDHRDRMRRHLADLLVDIEARPPT